MYLPVHGALQEPAGHVRTADGLMEGYPLSVATEQTTPKLDGLKQQLFYLFMIPESGRGLAGGCFRYSGSWLPLFALKQGL